MSQKIKPYKLQHFMQLSLLAGLSLFVVFYYIYATYTASCYFLASYLVITFVFAKSFFEKHMLKRSCTRSCYLQENTLLAKFVTSPIFPILQSLFLAVIYTLSLIYLVASLESYLVIFGLIYLPFASWVYLKLKKLITKQVSNKAQLIVTKNLMVFILSLLLIVISASYSMLFGYEPSFITTNLQETISLASNAFYSNCALLNFLLQIKAETSAYYWFAIKYSSDLITHQELKLLVWVIFLALNTLAIIAFNRLIAEVLSYSEKLLSS